MNGLLVRLGGVGGFFVLALAVSGCPSRERAPTATADPCALVRESAQTSGRAVSDARCTGAVRQCALADCPSARIWGVTIDDIAPLAETLESLRGFAVRPMSRVVFDEGQPAEYYRAALPQIHRVSDVMGELLDSQFVATLGVRAYAARGRNYLDTLSSDVDIWEVGNEVNGEWLGESPAVVAKTFAFFQEVRARGRARTALTLHYNEGCGVDHEHDMFAWAERYVPEEMKQNLNYVFVSYYEEDCEHRVPAWGPVFEHLGRMFPRAALGFGEVGTKNGSDKARYLARYYTMKIDAPRFVGGFFWWYFSDDMVPRTRPLWSVLNEAMGAK